MKNRSSFTIFTTIFSVLACIGLAYGTGGPDSPDPSPFPVNSNTADGFRALENSDNAFNSGFGWFSLFTNTDAFFNTGLGAGTLFANDGPNNTAVGAAALFFNSTGGNENAVGVNALRDNDSGFFNNAHGTFALFHNFDGSQNNAFGDQALIDNVSGNFNTGIGDDALLSCTGNSNTALGDEAGSNVGGGEGNIYIGAQVPAGTAGEFEFIRIGNDTAFTFPYDTYIAGIYNRSPGVGVIQTVGNTPDGKLFSPPSSRRFKHDIKPMDKASSEAILALKPVSFHYNGDTTNTPYFGVIAEDVAEVAPDLVVRDKEGKPHAVRYEQINVMLLNEFLKEHKKVEKQQASISQLKSEMQTMVAQLKEQAAQIQKVSARLEVNKPAPQVVTNKP